MPAHTRLLVGAPPYIDCLDVRACTLDELLPAFVQHVKPTFVTASARIQLASADDTSGSKGPVWRLLNLKQTNPITGSFRLSWTDDPRIVEDDNVASFYKSVRVAVVDGMGCSYHGMADASEFTNASNGDSDEESFVEESFAMHESATEQLGMSTVRAGTTSSDPSIVRLTDVGDDDEEEGLLQDYLGELTTLSCIPNAQTLDRLNPQTVTLDMLVAVISAPPPRTVCIRRTGKDVELVEIVVGDDTRAGLQVTFWLDSVEQEPRMRQNGEGLRKTLTGLRAGDVILIQNVALAHFRGMVHGQSLRWRRTNGGWATNVTVICRQHANEGKSTLDQRVESLSEAEQRVQAVKGWARQFIRPRAQELAESGQARSKRKRPEEVDGEEGLPPNDTPD